MALPPRLGGLGIVNPVNDAQPTFEMSKDLSSSLASLIVDQIPNLKLLDQKAQKQRKAELVKEKVKKTESSATQIHDSLPPRTQRASLFCSERGASSWVTALPVSSEHFSLNHQEFRVRSTFGTIGLFLTCQLSAPVGRKMTHLTLSTACWAAM